MRIDGASLLHDHGPSEAFSDGVFAVIITISGARAEGAARRRLGALRPLTPVFLAYV